MPNTSHLHSIVRRATPKDVNRAETFCTGPYDVDESYEPDNADENEELYDVDEYDESEPCHADESENDFTTSSKSSV
jgi:hypothetical protein